MAYYSTVVAEMRDCLQEDEAKSEEGVFNEASIGMCSRGASLKQEVS